MTEVPDWAIKVPQKITQLPPTNQWVGPTQDQMQQMRKQLLESILSAVVQAIRGIFIPGPFGAALEQLQEWTEDIPGEVVDWVDDNAGINLGSWEGFLDSLNDGKGIDLPVLMAVLQGLQQFFDGIDFSAPDFDPDDAMQVFAQMMKPLLDLTAKLRGLIDISWLTDAHQNLIKEPGYDDPATVATDDPNITHDATDGVPGSVPLGCLKMVANGVNHERGSELIEVGRGWELDAESRVKWESFTATAAANALRLELQPYSVVGDLATPVGSRVLVGAVASPSGNSSGTSGWGTTISGPYTVPSDGSVTHVALFPRMTSAATAGTAKFDNTNLVATQDIPQQFVKDLISDLQSLLDWITSWVDTGLNALGIPLVGDLFAKINDLADGLGGIQSDADDALAALADKLGLTEWDDFLNTLMTNPGSVISNFTQDLVTGLEDDLADAGDAIADVFDDVRDTWNKFWDGIFRTSGSTGKTAADVQTAATQVADNADAAQTTADTAQDSTIYLQTLLTLPRYTPRWLSSGPQDEVAFPVALINTTVTPTLGVLQLIPVTSETSRPVKSVKFGLAASTMTNLYVGIYRYDGTNLVLDANLGDIKSSLVGSKLQAYNMPDELSVVRGETVYIGVLQVGGTAAAMHATNIPTAAIIEPAQEIPTWIGSRYGSGLTALPGTFSAGAVVEQSGPLWGALGSEVGAPTIPPGAFYSDNFNRTAGAIGGNWTMQSGSLIISDNTLYTATSGRAVYNLPFNTNNQSMSYSGQGNGGSSTGLYADVQLLLRWKDANNYMRGWVTISGQNGPEFYISSVIGGTGVTRTGGPFYGTGKNVEFTAVDNVYRIYDDGVLKATWTDSGNLFPATDPAYRKGAVYLNSSSSPRYCWIDNWSMRDIT